MSYSTALEQTKALLERKYRLETQLIEAAQQGQTASGVNSRLSVHRLHQEIAQVNQQISALRMPVSA